MRMLRVLLALGLVCGLTGVAKAQAGDFQMVVIDPPPTNGLYYEITTPGELLTGIDFSTCSTGELPQGSPSYQGCILFANETGVPITGLQFTVPYSLGVVGQTAGCPTDPNDIFQSPSCPPNPENNAFTLTFTDGSISPYFPGSFFVVAENGVDPADFPEISVVASVPESRSIGLLAVDVVMCAGFVALWKRRRAIRVSNT